MAMAEQEPRLLAIAVRHRSRGTMQELAEAEVTREGGVADDFRGRPGRRQVTVLSLDSWQAACRQAGRPELPWTTRRANLLVSGVDLAAAGVLRIGEVELEVTGETAPCERMDEAFDGLRAALTPAWRGGVTCRVLRPGAVHPGAPVSAHQARAPDSPAHVPGDPAGVR
ncbi:MAG: MOSC domain-containing protein [Spirochaetaceae bacterium]|nr:MOSC domain-containing protein [Spirochaetaceae bacterium]